MERVKAGPREAAVGQAHLGGDASTGEIAAHVLTDGNADDAA